MIRQTEANGRWWPSAQPGPAFCPGTRDRFQSVRSLPSVRWLPGPSAGHYTGERTDRTGPAHTGERDDGPPAPIERLGVLPGSNLAVWISSFGG